MVSHLLLRRGHRSKLQGGRLTVLSSDGGVEAAPTKVFRTRLFEVSKREFPKTRLTLD